MDNRAFSYDVIAFENTKENASTVSIQNIVASAVILVCGGVTVFNRYTIYWQ